MDVSLRRFEGPSAARRDEQHRDERRDFYPLGNDDKKVHEDAQLQEPDGHNLKLLWADFLDAIVQKRAPVAGIEIAHRASLLSLLAMVSWKSGRSLSWDGDKEQIVGDSDANRLLSRAYRPPWTYPQV